MSKASKRVMPPRSERAGTRMAPDSYPLTVEDPTRPGQQVVVGWVDPAQRIFQGGGEYTEIVNTTHQPHLLSMPMEAWRRVQPVADRWEMVDHSSNTVYGVTLESARAHGKIYTTRLGQRFGVPLEWCDHCDAQGNTLYLPPTKPPKLVFGEVDPRDYMKGKRR